MSWYGRARSLRYGRTPVTHPSVRVSATRSKDPDRLASLRAEVHAFVLTAIFVFVIVIALFLALSYYAPYSGATQWLVFAVLIAFMGFLAVRAVGRVTRDPVPLAEVGTEGSPTGGDLASLRTTMERAVSGLRYSQHLVEDRLRRAFLEKVRASRGIPPEELYAQLTDLAALDGTIGDGELAAFVYESTRTGRGYPTLPQHPDFAERIDRLLARMEEWR